ncbi:MAG: TetR/AcrR family transcriptional regulator [Oricola sp.]
MDRKRSYTLRERAKSQEETRNRIVEATMQLHEEIGPRATTISAIAEKAGVQRLTVYRHFEDETAVFQACTAHWLSLNPPPDPADWAGEEDPRRKASATLAAFYRYYKATKRMWTVSFRDVADVPALQGPMAQFAGFVATVADDLVAAFAEDPDGRIAATLKHALAFPTWSNLDALGLDNAAKLALVEAWLDGVAGP